MGSASVLSALEPSRDCSCMGRAEALAAVTSVQSQSLLQSLCAMYASTRLTSRSGSIPTLPLLHIPCILLTIDFPSVKYPCLLSISFPDT